MVDHPLREEIAQIIDPRAFYQHHHADGSTTCSPLPDGYAQPALAKADAILALLDRRAGGGDVGVDHKP